MQGDEVRIEVKWILFELFGGRDNVLKIIEGNRTLTTPIEQLKRQSVQGIRCQEQRFELNELSDGDF